MATGLIDIMKRAAVDVVENNKPCDVRYGTVISISPLEIRLSTQLILPAEVLIVPKQLTNYSVEITSVSTSEENITEGDMSNKTRIIIHNALSVGDKVALLRESGGQQFYVLDRI